MIRQDVFLFFLLCFSFIVSAQEEEKAPSLVLKKKTIVPVEEQDDIWALDFGAVTWSDKSSELSQNRFSFELGLTYHFEFNFGYQHALAIGAGYRFSQLNHNGFFEINQTGIVYNTVGINEELDYSRLHLNQLSLPVELRLKFKNKLKLYIGYEGSFMLKAINRSKMEGEERLFRDFRSMNTLQYGPKIRVGISDFFLYFRYNASPLFNSNFGGLNYFSFGISLGG